VVSRSIPLVQQQRKLYHHSISSEMMEPVASVCLLISEHALIGKQKSGHQDIQEQCQ
jgi:hypothetical protein